MTRTMTRTTSSLRKRLLLVIITPRCLISAVGAMVDYGIARVTADAAFDQSLADAVLDIASHIQTDGIEPAVRLSAEAEAMLRNDPSDKIFYSIRDGNGAILAGDGDLPVPIGQAATAMTPYFQNSIFRGAPIRLAVHWIDAPRGGIMIAVGETLNKRNRVSRRIMTTMVMPGLAVIFATVLAVYFGVRRGLQPLDQVEGEIASRSARDLREIDSAGLPREIRLLVERLNDLFRLLREAAASQQRFLADAAHQLRTPLTGLQTQIELAASESGFESNVERMRRINEATQRIGHLVNQLLIYARTDSESNLLQEPEQVALDQLVEQSASLFLDPALGKGIDIGFDALPAVVTGVPWMIREALANLIDNALRYTQSGGVVTVSSRSTARAAMLCVEDNGPGIPETERHKVLGRFYRIAGSPGNGCGLGLAIVSEVANFHHASLELARAESGGLKVCLIFPLADATAMPKPNT